MDGHSFDNLTKVLAGRLSRRRALGAAVALAAPAALVGADQAAARCVAIGDPCKKKKDKCCEQGTCKQKVCTGQTSDGTVTAATYNTTFSGTSLNRPKGIALGSSGKAYVSENLENRLLVFKDNAYQTRYSSISGRNFNDPRGLALYGTQTLYVADTGNNRIMKLGTDGTVVKTWSQVEGSDNLSGPRDVAVYGDSVFVADTGNNRIVKFTSDGTKQAVFGPSTPGGRLPELSGPEGVAVADGGKVYVADTANNRIVVFKSSGEFLDEWTKTGGPDKQKLNAPRGIALDPDTNVFVADTDNDQVAVFDSQGVPIFRFNGPGSGTSPSTFNQPWGLAIRNDQLTVTDVGNNRVVVFDLTYQ